MSNDYRIRQRDIIPETCLQRSVGIIGCGAIGSHTATALAQMGIMYFHLIDDDVVSSENMSSQGFYPTDINKRKVDVIADRIKLINPDATVTKHFGRFDPLWVLENPHAEFEILISAVDNMETRAYANEYCQTGSATYLIDPRMGAEILTMATVNYFGKDFSWYANTLHSDENSVQERCTAKATIYTAQMASALVCKAVKDIITFNPYTQYITWNIKNNQILDYTVREMGHAN